jgi:hypothetical protein
MSVELNPVEGCAERVEQRLGLRTAGALRRREQPHPATAAAAATSSSLKLGVYTLRHVLLLFRPVARIATSSSSATVLAAPSMDIPHLLLLL